MGASSGHQGAGTVGLPQDGNGPHGAPRTEGEEATGTRSSNPRQEREWFVRWGDLLTGSDSEDSQALPRA
eukprot:3895604-Lingulodinium_polyedra.AAC.1